MPGVGMGVGGIPNARALQRRLRAAGAGGLQRELARQLQQAGRPVLLELRGEILAMPAHGPDSTGLRRKIAAATRSSPRVGGVRFYVSDAAMGGQYQLPSLIEAGAGWYHPVFGHQPYVYQNSWPWFQRTISANEEVLRRAVEDAMETIAALIRG
jgi:hypothetical protein